VTVARSLSLSAALRRTFRVKVTRDSAPLFAAIVTARFWQHSCSIPIQLEVSMNSNYVFLCGVMWCRYGQQEAGSELMRAAQGEDPDVSALALAMLEEGCRSLPQFRRVN